MAGSVMSLVCLRCGSDDVRWLGETRASVFVQCNRCDDVWRLDPRLDAARIDGFLMTHAVAAEPLAIRAPLTFTAR